MEVCHWNESSSGIDDYNIENRYEKGTKKKMDRINAFVRRFDNICQIAEDLQSQHPLTKQAALIYSIQLSDVEDNIDDLHESQALVDCVVLAHKFFEKETWNLHAIEQFDKGVFSAFDWSLQDYRDNESTIWMVMDFCLYPRRI